MATLRFDRVGTHATLKVDGDTVSKRSFPTITEMFLRDSLEIDTGLKDTWVVTTTDSVYIKGTLFAFAGNLETLMDKLCTDIFYAASGSGGGGLPSYAATDRLILGGAVDDGTSILQVKGNSTMGAGSPPGAGTNSATTLSVSGNSADGSNPIGIHINNTNASVSADAVLTFHGGADFNANASAAFRYNSNSHRLTINGGDTGGSTGVCIRFVNNWNDNIDIYSKSLGKAIAYFKGGDGSVQFASFINLPAQTAPANSADASGADGDCKRDSGGNLYIKFGTSWKKFAGANF
jgi:hypothetical protein